MPTDIQTTFSDEELAMLERVRVQQGLETVEQAAEWLAKRRLRRSGKRITGRARALQQVQGGKK